MIRFIEQLKITLWQAEDRFNEGEMGVGLAEVINDLKVLIERFEGK